MGRELRRVPADWEHPRNERGEYFPLYDEDFETAARHWKDALAAWERRDFAWLEANDFGSPTEEYRDAHEYWEWAGWPPDRAVYRPAWPEESRTHYQMYENTSEGTPISPVMPDIESLAHWLANNHASAFGGMTATYEQWLAMCQNGSAPAAVIGGGVMESGVAFIAQSAERK